MKRFLNSGFTIVEITIVIVTIGILSSMIYMSYGWYVKNTKETAIAQVVEQYQGLINNVVFEKDVAPGQLSFISSLPAGECLSDPTDASNSNGPPCCLINTTGASLATVCGNQRNLSTPFNNVSDMNSITKKYLTSNIPKLPDVPHSNLSDCTASISNSPCWTKEIGYIATSQASASSSPKGALVYYLPPDYDCQSKDVMTWSSTDNVYKYTTSQAYTSRTTTYTGCVIGIR